MLFRSKGHEDLIRRASKLFPQLIVAVAESRKKNTLFSLAERVELVKAVTQDLPNVKVIGFDYLLVDLLKQNQSLCIVRGARAVSDFEYEFQMAGMNQLLLPEAETIFLTPSPGYQFVSGTFVREIALLGGDVSKFVSSVVLEAFQKKLSKTSLNAPLAQGPR